MKKLMFVAFAALAVAGSALAAKEGEGKTISTVYYQSANRLNYITEAKTVWEDGEVPTAGNYYVNKHGIVFSNSK